MVCVRQGRVVLPWLFSLFVDGVIRKIKEVVDNAGVEICTSDGKWKLNISVCKLHHIYCRE